MENKEIKAIFSKISRDLSIWASQSYLRSFLVLFMIVVFGIPLVEYLQNLVRNFDYNFLINHLISFFRQNLDIWNCILVLILVLIIISIYLLNQQLVNNRVIKDNFKGGLNGWAIPIDAGWTTQKCIDVPGKMLTVTNSTYPGTLKGAYGWYDYQISFWAKIDKETPDDKQNFTLVIRSESNFNGVMFQITKNFLRPHFLYNGTFIVDNEARQQLPTILKFDEWIKVRLVVRGDNVDIFIDDYKLQYKIPTKVFNVANEVISKGTVSLEEIENSHNDIKNKMSKVVDILDMPVSPAKDEAMKTIQPILDSIPTHTKIILEFQKGSVGFRESGQEKTNFRDFKVERI